MDNNIITIFTPYYRNTKYLQKYLEYSVGNAEKIMDDTENDFKIEVIIDVNDPTIEEYNITEKWRKNHKCFKPIYTEQLFNWSESANRCIAASNGQYLTLWGIDDIRYSMGIIAQAMVLDDNSDIHAVAGDFDVVDEFNVNPVKHGPIWEAQHKTGMLFGPFFMFRKSVVEVIGGFDEQLKSGGDYDFCMRMVRRFKTTHIPICLGRYTNIGQGNSTNPNSLQPVERTLIEKRYGLNILEPKYLDKISNYSVDHLYFNGKRVPIGV